MIMAVIIITLIYRVMFHFSMGGGGLNKFLHLKRGAYLRGKRGGGGLNGENMVSHFG